MEFIKNLLKLNLQYFADEDPIDPPTDPPVDPPKTFTQDEVEDLIKKRLARVKTEVPSDYEDLKKRLKEFEDKDLTEFDKLKKDLEDKDSYVSTIETELNTLKEQTKQERIKSAFKLAAKKADIEYVDAALKLTDISSFEIGEDGNIEGLEDVVKKLAEDNPFLLSKEPKEIGDPSNPGGQDRTKTKDQLLSDAADRYRKTGRPEDLAGYTKLKRELSK